MAEAMRSVEDMQGTSTTEWYVFIFTDVCLMLAAGCIQALHHHMPMLAAAVGCVYILGRSLYKNSRGMFSNGYTTTEFYAYAVNSGMAAASIVHFPVETVWSCIALAGAYIISRSLTKSIGIKSQILIH